MPLPGRESLVSEPTLKQVAARNGTGRSWSMARAGETLGGHAVGGDIVLARIHVVSNRIGRSFYAEVESKHGVTLVEWRVLVALAHRGSATASEIVAAWGLEKMAASRAVARLARRGVVRRAAASRAGDRRRLPLALTAAGQLLYSKIEPDATRRYRAILAPLSTAERRTLARILAKLVARIDELS